MIRKMLLYVLISVSSASCFGNDAPYKIKIIKNIVCEYYSKFKNEIIMPKNAYVAGKDQKFVIFDASCPDERLSLFAFSSEFIALKNEKIKIFVVNVFEKGNSNNYNEFSIYDPAFQSLEIKKEKLITLVEIKYVNGVNAYFIKSENVSGHSIVAISNNKNQEISLIVFDKNVEIGCLSDSFYRSIFFKAINLRSALFDVSLNVINWIRSDGMLEL